MHKPQKWWSSTKYATFNFKKHSHSGILVDVNFRGGYWEMNLCKVYEF